MDNPPALYEHILYIALSRPGILLEDMRASTDKGIDRFRVSAFRAQAGSPSARGFDHTKPQGKAF